VAPKEGDIFTLTVTDQVRDRRFGAAPSSTPPCVDVWFARAMRWQHKLSVCLRKATTVVRGVARAVVAR
jgi:hypothetical protein